MVDGGGNCIFSTPQRYGNDGAGKKNLDSMVLE